jgi:FkbM family methyltransferase
MAFVRLRDEQLVASFEAGGFDWEMPVGDEIAREVFATGRHADAEIDALIGRFGAGSLLEIGANVGTTTLPSRVQVGRSARWNRSPRCSHIWSGTSSGTASFSTSVRCLQFAVSDRDGTATMVVPRGMYGSSYVVGRGHFAGVGSELSVRTLTVPTLLAELGDPPISLVWCDAEGSETVVMESGSMLWTGGVPLFVELTPDAVATAQVHFSSFSLDLDGSTRPIRELERFVDRPTDVLLLP